MKKIIKENYRVEVRPGEPWFMKDENKDKLWIQACNSLLSDIKRHCDFESIDWEYDHREVCEFCGSDWEIDEKGSPVCCREAIKEFDTKKEEIK